MTHNFFFLLFFFLQNSKYIIRPSYEENVPSFNSAGVNIWPGFSLPGLILMQKGSELLLEHQEEE